MSRNKNNKERIKKILMDGPHTTGEILNRLKTDETTRGTQKIIKNGKIVGYKKVKRSNRRIDTPTMNQLNNIMRSVAKKDGFCLSTRQVIWASKESEVVA